MKALKRTGGKLNISTKKNQKPQAILVTLFPLFSQLLLQIGLQALIADVTYLLTNALLQTPVADVTRPMKTELHQMQRNDRLRASIHD